MKRATLTSIVLSLGLAFSIPSFGFEKEKNKGAYVNYAHTFKPGTGLPEGIYKNPRAYKHKAVGDPKQYLMHALSLGHGGDVIVGYLEKEDNPKTVRCFINREGWDIAIHEPNVSSNKPETIFVYITEDRIITDSIKWHNLGKFSVKGTKDNLIRVDMGDIKLAYWVKIKDAKSMMYPEGVYSGFEASATFLGELCERLMN